MKSVALSWPKFRAGAPRSPDRHRKTQGQVVRYSFPAGLFNYPGARIPGDWSRPLLIDACTDTRYDFKMIKTFRHKGLKRLFERDNPSGVRADQVRRIKDVLAHLDLAVRPSDLDLPGYRLHPLQGELKGFWSVNISGNWRIIFRFEDGDAFDVDLVDYH